MFFDKFEIIKVYRIFDMDVYYPVSFERLHEYN